MNKHDNLKLSLTQKQHYNRDDISDVYPEYYLLKVNQFNDYAKTNLDQWVYFLKNSEIKDNFTAKGLTKAKEVFKVMNMSDDERKDYEKHLDFLSYMASLEETRVIDMEEAEKKGIEQGEYKKALEIAKSLKLKGIDFSIINEATGLTVEEIEKLK
jgi:predicted transposase/invertase (TIGR01784 family)